MENLDTMKPALRPQLLATFGERFDRRTVTIAVALVGTGLATYLGWDWLAAAGLTSLIIGLLPCAAMCGLGLCARRLTGQGGTAGCRATTRQASPGPSTTTATSAARAVESANSPSNF